MPPARAPDAAGVGRARDRGRQRDDVRTVTLTVAIVVVAGVVGHDVAEVVGAVRERRRVPGRRRHVPFAQSPTAPTRRTFVATPEVASDAVRAMVTVPLTIPPGAVFATATVEVGGVVSIRDREAAGCPRSRAGRRSRGRRSRTCRRRARAKCSACVLPGYVATSCPAAGGVAQAPGARQIVCTMLSMSAPGVQVKCAGDTHVRGRELRARSARWRPMRPRAAPLRSRRPAPRGWSVVPRRCSLRGRQLGGRQPTASVTLSRDSHETRRLGSSRVGRTRRSGGPAQAAAALHLLRRADADQVERAREHLARRIAEREARRRAARASRRRSPGNRGRTPRTPTPRSRA